MTSCTAAIEIPSKQLHVALAGNPNTGKTTLFNALTGYRQRVGNYPGVTVDKKTGYLRGGSDGRSVELIDLPGAYTLAARTADDALVLDVLLGQRQNVCVPDLIITVVDATSLARNLFLTSQILEIGKPVVVVLNMIDLAEASGIVIDADLLAEQLGVPVVPVVAIKHIGLDRLKAAIVEALHQEGTARCPSFPDCVCAALDGLTDAVTDQGDDDASRRAARTELLQTLLDPGGFREERLLSRCGLGLVSALAEGRRLLADAGESVATVEARVRYAWIDRVVERVVWRERAPRRTKSDVVDRVLTHRVFGLAVFLLLMGGCFQAIYTWAAPMMEAIDAAFGSLGLVVAGLIPAGALQSLVVNGVIAGGGAILVFLPQILILFLFIAILEDCGYMARTAFLVDRWMSLLGLNGQAFIPLLSSFACAIPGIMATRTIENRRDRLVTILIAPLMSCSARLPVYTLLIAAFIPAKSFLGGFIGLQAITLLAMYLIGVIVAIVVAVILKHTILKGQAQPFIMELPTYKWPTIKTVFYRMFEQGKVFCISAGTIIFAVVIIVWALGYYPHPSYIAAEHQAARDAVNASAPPLLEEGAGGVDVDRDAMAKDITATPPLLVQTTGDSSSVAPGVGSAVRAGLDDDGPQGRPDSLAERLAAIDRHEASAYLRQSILGRMGAWIEPAVRPLGWDWRIATVALASFPAREVVIAAMSTIYNLGAGTDEKSSGLRAKLQDATWPDGRPVYTVAVAMSVMVFFALCCQCGSTLATIRRETRSWRWPLLTFTYMTVLAYVAALVTYQTLNLVI